VVNLDLLSTEEVVEALLAGEERVVPAVRAVAADIARAADLVASRWPAGGRLVFVGAGTGGRLAWTQAAELPGTFGLPRERVLARVAGGLGSTDDDEDDVAGADRDLAELRLGAGDVVIAVAASGSTPYTVAVARAAAAAGADVIALVTTSGTPLGEASHVVVETPVGAEVLRDSTRLGAGTAQKITLDALTTAAATRLGHVHGDLMIDVVGANAKLRERVTGIVAEIAGCDLESARGALADCQGDARAAVLVVAGGLAPDDARRRAAAAGTLRAALSDLSDTSDTRLTSH
jgi:N-acetylmuramic acid 6-phosphate etherase